MPGFMFKCPKCRQDMEVGGDAAKPGGRVRCPYCGSMAPVPAEIIEAAQGDRTRAEEERAVRVRKKADTVARKEEKSLERVDGSALHAKTWWKACLGFVVRCFWACLRVVMSFLEACVDYFGFRDMVTPTLIKVVYFLGVFGSVIAMLVGVIPAFTGGALGAFVEIVVWNVIWRVLCEGCILFFSIHETLVSIERRIRARISDDAN